MIELRSPDGLARAVVLPERGGRLHQLYVTVDGREEPLLWSPDDPAEYAERPTRGGCFPMAPWPNRIANGRFTWEGREYEVPLDGKPHAIHGRVYNKAWDILESTDRFCLLHCALDEAWPWPGVVRQRISIGVGWLELIAFVESSGQRFPSGIGWHPWFRRDAFGASDVWVTIPASERYVLWSNIPSGEVVPVMNEFDLRDGAILGDRRLDECYRNLAGDIRIDWGRWSMDLHVGGHEWQNRHVQVFTPPEAFCIEPQTCPPDAFNLAARGVEGTGIVIAEAGKPTVFSMSWKWAV